jgi:DNA-binding response OmpR family regulator
MIPISGMISPAERPRSGRQPNARLRVLVVDDEPLICRLNADILQGAGYEVDIAEDGSAAWHALQRHDYDLLVTDNQMPKVSGVELVLRMHEAKMELPVIMATGTLPDEEFAWQLWPKPFVMLLKPYGLPELLETVKWILHAVNGGSGRTLMAPNWVSQPPALGAGLN